MEPYPVIIAARSACGRWYDQLHLLSAEIGISTKPMELLLDIGNSRIKWASSQHGALAPSTALSYQSGNFAQTLQEIAGHITKPDRVIVSNVAGEKIAALLTEWAQSNWEIKIEALAAEKNAYGVRNT